MKAALRSRLLERFASHYQAEPTVLAWAPGRVNLIGEHTDYNDGFVLPCALPVESVIAARARDDGLVQVFALDQVEGEDRFLLATRIPARASGHWANYVRGLCQLAHAEGMLPGGADLMLAGDIPQGAGLSSSASLLVALGTACQALTAVAGSRQARSPAQIARLAQRAENEYVGCHCGIMDQLASACGRAGHALLLDCRSLEIRHVPVPAGAALLVLHSRVRRGLVDSAYNARRQQCLEAARHYDVPALRDLDWQALHARRGGLDDLQFRRARHVVSENQRTLASADALGQGDFRRLGELMAASHASMRDDFDITHPAVDQLVAIIAQAIGGEGGARMTGGGFGGCVVAVVPEHLQQSARVAVEQQYRSPDGLPAYIDRWHASAGADWTGATGSGATATGKHPT